jgi:hypothetical protein
VTRVRPLRAPHEPEVERQHRMMPRPGPLRRLIVVNEAWPRMRDGGGARFLYRDDQGRRRPHVLEDPTVSAHHPTTTTIPSRGAEMSSKTGSAAVTLISRRPPQSCTGGASPAPKRQTSTVRSDATVPITGPGPRSQVWGRGADCGPAAGVPSCGVALERYAPALPATPGDYFGRLGLRLDPSVAPRDGVASTHSSDADFCVVVGACISSKNGGMGEAYMTHVVAEANLLRLIESADDRAQLGAAFTEHHRRRTRAGPIRSVQREREKWGCDLTSQPHFSRSPYLGRTRSGVRHRTEHDVSSGHRLFSSLRMLVEVS